MAFSLSYRDWWPQSNLPLIKRKQTHSEIIGRVQTYFYAACCFYRKLGDFNFKHRNKNNNLCKTSLESLLKAEKKMPSNAATRLLELWSEK